MTREQIEKEIIEIMVQSQLIDDSESYDLKASLIEEYGFTSIKIIQLIIAIETKFSLDINIEDLSIEKYESIDSIIDMTVNYMEGK